MVLKKFYPEFLRTFEVMQQMIKIHSKKLTFVCVILVYAEESKIILTRVSLFNQTKKKLSKDALKEN